MKTPHLFRAALDVASLSLVAHLGAQEPFNGLGSDMSNLYRTSSAKTRSISA